MKKILTLFGCCIFLFSCNKESGTKSEENLAVSIVEKSLIASGGELFESSKVSFTFRDKQYKGSRKGGEFELTRSFNDSIGKIEDVFKNESFARRVNGVTVSVPDTMIPKYERSINSVFYFAQLPYKLNDAAVIKKYLGEETLKNKVYHKIKVQFEQEGGGEDHDDTFIYWINKESNFIDYLAYEYSTDGGGMRFRENYNERIVNGMRFVDAINLKPKVKGSIEIENVGKAFEEDGLTELSRIELENVKVEIIE